MQPTHLTPLEISMSFPQLLISSPAACLLSLFSWFGWFSLHASHIWLYPSPHVTSGRLSTWAWTGGTRGYAPQKLTLPARKCLCMWIHTMWSQTPCTRAKFQPCKPLHDFRPRPESVHTNKFCIQSLFGYRTSSGFGWDLSPQLQICSVDTRMASPASFTSIAQYSANKTIFRSFGTLWVHGPHSCKSSS